MDMGSAEATDWGRGGTRWLGRSGVDAGQGWRGVAVKGRKDGVVL